MIHNMDKIAFFIGSSTPVYWRTLLIILGIASSVFIMIALCLLHGRKVAMLLLAIPASVMLSLFLGRLIHWYCFPEEYTSFFGSITDIVSGRFSLLGAFPGTVLIFALLCKKQPETDLPGLLDDLSIAGSFGIAVGRLGELFGSADRGKLIFDDQIMHHLPLSAVVINEVSGEEEWRFATFCFQSIWSAIIFLILVVMIILKGRNTDAEQQRSKGHAVFLFFILYCLGQILLDSTRYDAMFLRSNGFVSLEQIICSLTVTALMMYISILGIKTKQFKVIYPICWMIYLAGAGLAGYMEYYVQRHSGKFVYSYNLMAVGLFVMLASICAISRYNSKTIKDT